jgi:hypothetical protein
MNPDSGVPDTATAPGSDGKLTAISAYAADSPFCGVVSDSRYRHDLRASLAIINGYSKALESSFQELTDHCQDLLGAVAVELNPDTLAQVQTLKADCRFCLSRLNSSVEQLKDRLAADDLTGAEDDVDPSGPSSR